MGKPSKDYLDKLYKECESREDAYVILFMNYLIDNPPKHEEIGNLFLKKFPNFYLTSPPALRDNFDFAKIGIKQYASNILYYKDGNASFDELKEFVKINPFVPTYCVNISKKEQSELYLDAFKNTDKYCFLEYIPDPEFLEGVYLLIYFGKLKTSNQDAIEKATEFINTLKKEEIDEIKEIIGI